MRATPDRNRDSIPFSSSSPDLLKSGFSTIAGGSGSLKHQVKYGVFLWWSDRSPSWVHPDDLEVASDLVPGNRVFRKEKCKNFADRKLGFSSYRYGSVTFRGLPAIWREVRHDGFEINDLVEIKSGYGRRRAGLASIGEIIWDRHAQVVKYSLTMSGQRIERLFLANEFQPAARLGSHLTSREIELATRLRFA